MLAFFILFALALVASSAIVILLGGKVQKDDVPQPNQDGYIELDYPDQSYPNQPYSNISNWGELARSFDPDDTQQVWRVR